ncbi:MAG TPA: competence protein ComFB [Ruminococcaceae bacterium]|nr:competence protein ComFB [Oscillospiraceae bacterium]
MPIVNVMERFVEQKMDEILPTVKCCTCEKCLDDIRAMALNKLPPKYVSTDKGKLFSKLNSLKEKQNGVDIHIAVLSAIEFVAANPRHDHSQQGDEKKSED